MNFKELIYKLCRFFPAFILMIFGISKLAGTQFGVSEWVADLPMSQQTGFNLTWYYFSYSDFYGYVLAAVQLGGAVLLMFRRTALLGAVLLMPVMANIVLINIVYQITDGAFMMSVLIALSLLVIILFHFNELRNFFLRDRDIADISSNRTQKIRVLFIIGKSAIILIPILIYFYVSSQQTPKSPVDGVWNITEWNTEMENEEIPNRIYFETISNHHAMFRYQEFRRQYRFEFDTDRNEISIFLPRTDGPENFFKGNYAVLNDTLMLKGTLKQIDTNASIILSKAR